MADEIIRYSESGEQESIAETNIVEQLNIMLRDLEECFRELLFMVKDLDEGRAVAVDKRYGRVRSIKDNIENTSVNLMDYVIKVSPILTFKDIYLYLIQDIVRAAEHAEAAAYRNLLLNTKEFERLPDKLYAELDETVRKIIDMVSKVRTMLEKIRADQKYIRELYIELLKVENAVDEYYRESGLEIIKHYSKDVGALILLKELFDKLEDSADIMKRVGTYIRFISIHR
ncbi:MAG: hypothetical protein J7J11_04980 [Desulfurococcales archaeon]|nr:hypothetical protein [Desulfurococcales archaeon]MCD6279013.1 hypothetical protein [Desulfurococcales archaeon]